MSGYKWAHRVVFCFNWKICYEVPDSEISEEGLSSYNIQVKPMQSMKWENNTLDTKQTGKRLKIIENSDEWQYIFSP